MGLACLAVCWQNEVTSPARANQWTSLLGFMLIVILACSAFGFIAPEEFRTTPDLKRYVSEIEKEFESLPAEKVLLDSGDWPYFQQRILARDRHPILVTHRGREWEGFADRLRRKEYARLLVHIYPDGSYSYDLGADRRLRETILENYSEVRRITPVRGMQDWRYARQFLGEIVVFEPNGAGQP
jgi:hypothetical protein